jgi:hypothetical protein
VGLELTNDGTTNYALVLMEDVDALQKVDLSVGTASELLLEEPPIGIDAMPDGSFVVTHDASLGLITFVDATTEALVPAAGFAATGLLERPTLPRRGTEE